MKRWKLICKIFLFVLNTILSLAYLYMISKAYNIGNGKGDITHMYISYILMGAILLNMAIILYVYRIKKNTLPEEKIFLVTEYNNLRENVLLSLFGWQLLAIIATDLLIRTNIKFVLGILNYNNISFWAIIIIIFCIYLAIIFTLPIFVRRLKRFYYLHNKIKTSR